MGGVILHETHGVGKWGAREQIESARQVREHVRRERRKEEKLRAVSRWTGRENDGEIRVAGGKEDK